VGAAEDVERAEVVAKSALLAVLVAQVRAGTFFERCIAKADDHIRIESGDYVSSADSHWRLAVHIRKRRLERACPDVSMCVCGCSMRNAGRVDR
jgi:hypothetical protein